MESTDSSHHGSYLWMLLLTTICIVHGCDYEVRLNYAGPCLDREEGSRNILIPRNMSVKLTSDCKLRVRGCLDVKERIPKKVQMEWKFKKGLFHKEGTIDFCSDLRNKDVQTVTRPNNLPQGCPVKAQPYWIKNLLVEVQNYLYILKGNVTLTATLQNDKTNANLACVQVELSILKT